MPNGDDQGQSVAGRLGSLYQNYLRPAGQGFMRGMEATDANPLNSYLMALALRGMNYPGHLLAQQLEPARPGIEQLVQNALYTDRPGGALPLIGNVDPRTGARIGDWALTGTQQTIETAAPGLEILGGAKVLKKALPLLEAGEGITTTRTAIGDEPWMLSRAEYLDRAGFEDPLSEAEMQRITRPHRLSVEQALKEGREVPKHVLAEYPDLEEKAGELAVGATVASKAQELARAAQTAHRAEELEETAEKVHQTHLAMHATEIAKQEQRDQEKRRVKRDAPPPPIPPPPVPPPAPNLLQTLQGLGGSGMPPGGPPQMPMMPGS